MKLFTKRIRLFYYAIVLSSLIVLSLTTSVHAITEAEKKALEAIQNGDFTWQQAKLVLGKIDSSAVEGVNSMDEMVCAMLKKADNRFTGIPYIELSTDSLYFNDNEDITNLETYKNVKASGKTKGCKKTTSGISVGGSDSTQGTIDNVFFGYNTNNINIRFNTPPSFYDTFYHNKTYGGAKACSEGHGLVTRGDIERSSGKGCNAYSFIGENKHSLVTNKTDTDITLKVNPSRFIGEDGHDMVSKSCGESATSDCYSRKVFAYFCPASNKSFHSGYPLNKYACHFQSFGDFKVYVMHLSLTAQSQVTSTGSSISSSDDSQTLTFTHKYKNNNSDYEGTPATSKVTQTINGGSETVVCNENGPRCVNSTSNQVIVGKGGISVPNGGKVKVCQKNTITWKKTKYSKKSSGIGAKATSSTETSTDEKCSTITGAPIPTGGATFTVSSSNATDKTWNDGRDHVETVIINHTINRTDSNANPASIATKYYIEESFTGPTGTYTRLTPSSGYTSSKTFTTTDKTQSINQVSNQISIPKDKTIVYCQKIYAISSADALGNLQTAVTSGTPGCVTLSVSSPTKETDIVTPHVILNSTTSLAYQSPGTYIGTGKTTSYTLKFRQWITRDKAAHSPNTINESYSVYYTINDGTKNYYTGSTANTVNLSSNANVPYAETSIPITVPINSSTKVCSHLDAQGDRTYSYEIDDSGNYIITAIEPNPLTTKSAEQCITVVNPIKAYYFDGKTELSMKDPLLNHVSGEYYVYDYSYPWNPNGTPHTSDWLGSSDSVSTFKTGFKHTLWQTGTNSYEIPTQYQIHDNTNNGSYNDTLVSWRWSDPIESGGITHALAVRSPNPITGNDNVQVAAGRKTRRCERLGFNSWVNYDSYSGKVNQDGSWSGIETGGGYTEKFACITIGKPGYRYESNPNSETVTVNSSIDDPTYDESKVEIKNGKYYIKSGQTVDFSFRHNIYRSLGELESNPKTTEPATTSGSLYISGTNANNGNPKEIDFNLTGNATESETLVSNVNNFIIGSEKTICHNNAYKSKTFTINYLDTYVRSKIEDDPTLYYDEFYSRQPDPKAATGHNDTGNAAQKCITVTRPYNFKITNAQNANTGNFVVYPGEKKDIRYTIFVNKNDSWEDYSITGIPNAKLRILRIILDDDAVDSDIDSTGTNSYSGSNPCNYFTSNSSLQAHSISCDIPKSADRNINNLGTGGEVVPYNLPSYRSNYTFSGVEVPDDIEIGQKFCTAFAVNPINSGDGFTFDTNWYITDLSCGSIGKKPTMQVWGGSVFAEGNIKTSQTAFENKIYGSWSDFTIISQDDIATPGSGASLADGRTDIDSSNCKISPLTITNNKCNEKKLGKANIDTDTTELIDKLKNRLIPDGENIPYTENGISASGKIITSLSNGKLAGTIYYASGDLEINQDIEISDTFNSIFNIPMIVIIADGNVIIDEKNVNRIDAWILTKKEIRTCGYRSYSDSKPFEGLNSEKCDQQLIINGPVIAKNASFFRTYGGDTQKNTGDGGLSDPAERIDYNPIALLWAYAMSISSGQPQTVHLKELAPRY